jgi:hypothetical protein
MFRKPDPRLQLLRHPMLLEDRQNTDLHKMIRHPAPSLCFSSEPVGNCVLGDPQDPSGIPRRQAQAFKNPVQLFAKRNPCIARNNFEICHVLIPVDGGQTAPQPNPAGRIQQQACAGLGRLPFSWPATTAQSPQMGERPNRTCVPGVQVRHARVSICHDSLTANHAVKADAEAAGHGPVELAE